MGDYIIRKIPAASFVSREVVPTRSGRLFSRPSLIQGIGRLLDFGGTLTQYNASPTEAQADCEAIRSDWMAVGDDIRSVIASEQIPTSK